MISQCRQCNRLAAGLVRGLCPECITEREEQFEAVREELRREPARSVGELSDRTGVDRDVILGFVQEGRLEIAGAQEAVATTCRSCGKPSETGDLCTACRERLAAGLARPLDRPSSGYSGMHSKG